MRKDVQTSPQHWQKQYAPKIPLFWSGQLQLPPHTHSLKDMAVPLETGEEDMVQMVDLAQVNALDARWPGIVPHTMIA
jgi:hypothetical protein